MDQINPISNNQIDIQNTDNQYIDDQLQAILNLVRNGKTFKAMKKCTDLQERFKNNEPALQKIKDFMNKFIIPNRRSFSYRIEPAGDNVDHFDILQEIIYRQPIGERNRFQLSLKYFDKDKISGGVGFFRHDGGLLDTFEYEVGGEAFISPGDPETSTLNQLPLFKVVGSARYSLIYSKGYFGYNRGIGFYGDEQLGVTFNGFNVGAGYAYFPYFNTYNNRVENNKGFYTELGRYFQLGEKIGLFGFTKIPIGTMEQRQLPLYFGLNLNINISNHVGLNLQGSYLYTKDYMQGRGSAGLEINF